MSAAELAVEKVRKLFRSELPAALIVSRSSMKKPESYGSRTVLFMVLILIGSGQLSNIAAQTSTNNSYEVVMRLSRQFNESGDVSALKSLTEMLRSERFGANAAGALTLLARRVTRDQAETVVVPALITGLRATNVSIRRGSAIALGEYSPHAASAVPVLIDFLAQSTELDKFNADYFVIDALGRVGKEASPAVPTLLKVIDWPDEDTAGLGDTFPRVAAVSAIDRIGFLDSTTRTRLEKGLGDSNLLVRRASASALIDNGFVSEPALATLYNSIATNDLTFTLKPTTLRIIHGAATNTNASIAEAAGLLLKRLKKE